jgi:hypothetical protein
MIKWQLLFFLLPFVAAAQPDSTEHLTERIYLSVKQKAGFLAAHRGVMGHLPKEHVIGGEISLYKKVGGNASWHQVYKYPYVGVTLYGSTVGNNAILGQAYGIYSFIEFPFLNSRRNQVSGKLSCGLGYITKVFDQETNPKNVAMSSHLNALICLGLQGRVRLAQRHQLLYGFDLTHLSNGSSKVPNLGLNMVNLSLGYAYVLRSKQITVPPIVDAVDAKYGFFQHWKLHLLGVLSDKQVFPTGGKHYPVYAVSLMGRRLFRPKVGMETAIDLISKQAVFGYKRYIPKTQWTILQVGVYAAYVLPLDHFQFVLGMGVYVKDRYQPDGPLYHRIGMRYQFNNGITANLVLKSHWAKADYVEWGIGYTFKHGKK